MNTQKPKRASWSKRFFAYEMSRSSAEYNDMVGDRKKALLGGLYGTVLEIGPGTAPNLAWYPADVQWIGIEPNPAMFAYVRKEAERLGRTIDLREGHAERLPMADQSVDSVVSTLVLCSVRDPRKAVQEIWRVLKPGGKFIFIEHVAAPRGSELRRWQAFIRPIWKMASDGCHIDRETWAIIENAGFSRVQIDHFRVDAPIVSPHIAGFAVK